MRKRFILARNDAQTLDWLNTRSGWVVYEIPANPNWLVVEIRKKSLLEAALAFGPTRVRKIPPFDTPIERLSANVQAEIGVVAPDARTVGQAIRDAVFEEELTEFD